MKTKILTILIVLSVSNLFAQTDSLRLRNDIDNIKNNLSILESKIETIQSANTKILQENKSIKNKYFQLNKEFDDYKQLSKNKIDSLGNIISINSSNIEKTADELGVKIETTKKETNQSITGLSDKVSKNMLYWIIAILLILIALIIVFVVLKKQIFKQKTDLNSDLEKTRKVLEEESIKLDNKLIELLETQLKILNNNNLTIASKDEADHSLALKVADEIVRIEKNIARMDSNTKGLKPLIKGIERIKDNFKANGYEMVQLLGVEYNDGMNIDVINFFDDENIPEGKRVITKIIKPQVNYKGVLIQRAQVDVSQN